MHECISVCGCVCVCVSVWLCVCLCVHVCLDICTCKPLSVWVCTTNTVKRWLSVYIICFLKKKKKCPCTKIHISLKRWAAKLGNKELAEQILKNSKCEVNYLDRETGKATFFNQSPVLHIALLLQLLKRKCFPLSSFSF